MSRQNCKRGREGSISLEAALTVPLLVLLAWLSLDWGLRIRSEIRGRLALTFASRAWLAQLADPAPDTAAEVARRAANRIVPGAQLAFCQRAGNTVEIQLLRPGRAHRMHRSLAIADIPAHVGSCP